MRQAHDECLQDDVFELLFQMVNRLLALILSNEIQRFLKALFEIGFIFLKLFWFFIYSIIR